MICVITPYKEQAALMWNALWKAIETEFWQDKNTFGAKVYIVDLIYGNEPPMVITDLVLAKNAQDDTVSWKESK